MQNSLNTAIIEGKKYILGNSNHNVCCIISHFARWDILHVFFTSALFFSVIQFGSNLGHSLGLF